MPTRYYPDVFDVPDLRRAKEIILTNEGPGADTDTRWAQETPYLVGLIGQTLALRPGMLVLDYGCGIGRMAKALIEGIGCSVIGVDISPSMRRLAVDYVGTDRFTVVSPAQFDTLSAAGLRVHAALAIWVLQHCVAPAEDVERIRRSLAADGGLFVLNMVTRAIPAVHDEESLQRRFAWTSDGIDVAALLRGTFHVTATGEPDMAQAPKMTDAKVFWMSLRR